jgi:alpha-tubulin suppressor-like RCC1 family protein
MNRRRALALLAAFPFAARLDAQMRPTSRIRVVLGGAHGFLFEPGGTLKTWRIAESPDDLAPDWLGLGHNRAQAKYTLYSIPSLANVVAAAAGTSCSFAVLGDGRLMSWGSNSGNGLLGTTPRSAFEASALWGPNSNTPVPVVTKFDAVDVSCTNEHAVALARDGSVYAWGRDSSLTANRPEKGQLGVGPLPTLDFKANASAAETYMPFPVRVPTLSDVVAVRTGSSHSLALLKDGTVQAWGQNYSGQLGDGTTMARDRPVVVQRVRSAIAIAAAAEASAAVVADGTVMTWGDLDGQKPSPVPSLVPGVRGVRALAAGSAHLAALTQAGTVITWGSNQISQLGRGRAAAGPGLVKDLSGVESIAAGGVTTIAVLRSGRVMTWGGVRPWTRPPEQGGLNGDVSSYPILLWLDGPEQV